MRLVPFALSLVILFSPLAANAGGDICLVDFTFGRIFVLTKPRIPKAPGSAAPIAGQMFDAVSLAGVPVAGSVARQTLGRLNFGLTQHLLPCQMNINTDDSLEGSIQYDCNFDGIYEIESEVAPGDCRQVL